MVSKKLKVSEVALHKTNSDCWTIIHGKVYDLTKFRVRHPGGDAILQACGTDATELFEKRPMGSKTPHSGMARELLDDYLIGEVEK